MPHINLFYPVMLTESQGLPSTLRTNTLRLPPTTTRLTHHGGPADGGLAVEELPRILSDALSNSPAFNVSLDSFGTFHHPLSSLLWAGPNAGEYELRQLHYILSQVGLLCSHPTPCRARGGRAVSAPMHPLQGAEG